jgi:poly(hydroxyalkanoate) depolymerase family esterase
MNSRFLTAMRKATAVTRALNPVGATRLIQAALLRAVSTGSTPKTGSKPQGAERTASKSATLDAPRTITRQPMVIGGHFTMRSFRCDAGARNYKLFVPVNADVRKRGLIIMLHGCTQNPDDFAAGTRMNEIAEREGLIIAYPAQTRAHNASSCWNWFQTGDQVRDKGEPAILAGIARELMTEFGFGRDEVFIAGLSAGGAMAVIMVETYPDLFSAVGVHSGLPYQSADNVMSALTAMRGRVRNRAATGAGGHSGAFPTRTIVFHGSADKTVHPSNAKNIVDDATSVETGITLATETGKINGKRYIRLIMSGADEKVIVENWTIDGAGHAWSGGNSAGSFTDAQGPDASSEMVRFFMAG